MVTLLLQRTATSTQCHSFSFIFNTFWQKLNSPELLDQTQPRPHHLKLLCKRKNHWLYLTRVSYKYRFGLVCHKDLTCFIFCDTRKKKELKSQVVRDLTAVSEVVHPSWYQAAVFSREVLKGFCFSIAQKQFGLFQLIVIESDGLIDVTPLITVLL